MSVSLGRLVDINPATPEFDRLSNDERVTFLPLEACWPDGRADTARTALRGDVSVGYTRFKRGDVLMPKITPTFEAGRVFVVDSPTAVGAATTELHVLRARPNVEPRFVAYACRTRAFLQEGHASLQGVGNLRRVPVDFIRLHQVMTADLNEQRQIVGYLDRETAKIDALIEKQGQLIEMLHERMKAISERAVTRGIDGDQPLVPSRIEWISRSPAHWTIGRMKYDTRMVGGGTPDTGDPEMWTAGEDGQGLPWVSIGDMSQRNLVLSTKKSVTDAAISKQGLPVGSSGTLLLAMYASVGEVAHLGIEATWNQAILGITPTTKKYDSFYLGEALRSMRNFMLRDARSSTQANLNASQVGDFWLPCPPFEEQRRIVRHINNQKSAINSLIAKAERFIDLARERRSALITAAVTGQIDVREAS